MSVLIAYMAGGEGVVGRGFKMFSKRGSEFFLLALCLWGGGGGRRDVRFNTSSFVKKITDPPRLIN